MNSTLHLHLTLRYPFEEKIKLPSNLRRFFRLTSLSRYLPVEIISMKIKMAFASYETLGFES
jgi:hypothetical protein